MHILKQILAAAGVVDPELFIPHPDVVLRRIPNFYLDPSSIHISEEKSIFVLKITYYNCLNFYRYMMFS